MCRHLPQCPHFADPSWHTARTVPDHVDRKWVRTCAGLILFDDHVCMGPDGHCRPVPACAA